MNSHLFLFKQVPVGSTFQFEGEGTIFTKVSEEAATHVGINHAQPVNPGVLVFPTPNPIEIAQFTLRDGSKWAAIRVSAGWWLDRIGVWYPGQLFRTLEDVINHLGE